MPRTQPSHAWQLLFSLAVRCKDHRTDTIEYHTNVVCNKKLLLGTTDVSMTESDVLVFVYEVQSSRVYCQYLTKYAQEKLPHGEWQKNHVPRLKLY